MTRHTQPCGGKTGHGCGQPVAPTRRRLPGQIWWHRGRDCQLGRDAWQAATKRDRRRRRGTEPAADTADIFAAFPAR